MNISECNEYGSRLDYKGEVVNAGSGENGNNGGNAGVCARLGMMCGNERRTKIHGPVKCVL